MGKIKDGNTSSAWLKSQEVKTPIAMSVWEHIFIPDIPFLTKRIKEL